MEIEIYEIIIKGLDNGKEYSFFIDENKIKDIFSDKSLRDRVLSKLNIPTPTPTEAVEPNNK